MDDDEAFVSSTRFLVCETVMFQNPADGTCAERAHGTNGTIGAARRRRNRQLHASLKHERMTVAMNLATVQHHSFMKSTVVGSWCAGGGRSCALTATTRLLKSLTVHRTKRPL